VSEDDEIDAAIATIDDWHDAHDTNVAAAKATLFRTRAWVKRGYGSWENMCAERRWGRHRITLDERREEVVALRAEGMSTRAIAAATGVDAKTVRNDLKSTGDNSPVVDTVTSLDGRQRPATRPAPEPPPVPAEAYEDAITRYPQLDIDGADIGDIVDIAAMVDARPEHERDSRADAGAAYLAAKVAGRLDPRPDPTDTTSGEQVYEAAYRTLRVLERHADSLPSAAAHVDPTSRAAWASTLTNLADRAAAMADSITKHPTLRSIK